MTEQKKTRKEYLAERVREECAKCSGTGSVSWGVDLSARIGNREVPKVCFDCDGYGYRTVTRRTIEDRARRAEKARREIEEREAGLRERRAAWQQENADLAPALAPWGTQGERRYPQSLVSLAVSIEDLGWLSEDDTAEARALLAQVAAKEASEVEVPEGRQTVEGEVVSVKWQENAYGGALKMLVQADGFRVFGSVPSAIEVESGDRVRFVATLAPREKGFGFFSRPTKAEVL